MNTRSLGEIRPATPKIQASLTHRIKHDASEPLSARDLIVGIEGITNRSNGVLAMVQGICLAENGDALREINQESVYFALESVRKDLEDLVVIAAALRKAGAA